MPYTRTGKQVLFIENGVSTHIADAGDAEKAHLIVDRLNGHSTKFIPQALATCSPLFHGDMVSEGEFRATMAEAIEVLNRLDKIKKSLFYGRDNNLIAEGQADASQLPERITGERAVGIDIIHCILGVATEAGELLEALREGYNGNGFDWVNIKEEFGDIHWYEALAAKHGDFTFEETTSLIIAKLRKRFPDKFTAFDANNRDLASERAILEGSGNLTADGRIIGTVESLTASETGDITNEMLAEAAESLDLAPTPYASGPEAVREIEGRAKAAFDAVAHVGKTGVDAPATTGTGQSELAKSPAARTRQFPDEHLSHQKVRPEDLD